MAPTFRQIRDIIEIGEIGHLEGRAEVGPYANGHDQRLEAEPLVGIAS